MRSPRQPQRRWTRLAIVGITAHVFYELLSGVGMPLASFVGPAPAATWWASAGAVGLREAARRRRKDDWAFAVLNGLFLSAVLAHFAYWPTRKVVGLPYLTECEGLRGRLMPPYNLILYASAMSAVGGLIENRQARLVACALPIGTTPLLMLTQDREFARLRVHARRRPGWWNRRLQVQ